VEGTAQTHIIHRPSGLEGLMSRSPDTAVPHRLSGACVPPTARASPRSACSVSLSTRVSRAVYQAVPLSQTGCSLWPSRTPASRLWMPTPLVWRVPSLRQPPWPVPPNPRQPVGVPREGTAEAATIPHTAVRGARRRARAPGAHRRAARAGLGVHFQRVFHGASMPTAAACCSRAAASPCPTSHRRRRGPSPALSAPPWC
jgi:hypothetical protein